MGEKQYRSGTYTGEGMGFEDKLTAKVVIEDNQIKEIEFDDTNSHDLSTQVNNQLREEILAKQSVDVEAVSGASYSSRAVVQAVSEALAKASGQEEQETSAEKDLNGVFQGSAKGMDGEIQVEVTFDDNKITNIKIISENESAGIGEYTLEEIPKRIIESQSVSVDSLSGATVSSMGIKRAVEEAIKAGEGDLSSFTKAVPTESQDEEFTYDVVVVGGGLSGLMASIEAKENGAKVALLEKQDILGGSSAMSSGNLLGASSEEHVEPMFNAWLQRSKIQTKNPINQELLKALVQVSPNVMEVFKEAGVEFKIIEDDNGSQTFKAKPSERSAKNAEAIKLPSKKANAKGGGNMLKKLWHYAKEIGVDIYLGTPVNELLTEANEVVGVVSESKAGKKVFHSKAVVLASGDYAHNNDMAEKYAPEAAGEYSASAVGNTGDGHRLAIEQGAAMTSYQDSMSGVFNANPYDQATIGDPTNDYPFESLVIDMEANRPFKEDGNSHAQKYHFKRPQGRNNAWCIMDKDIAKDFIHLDEYLERTAKGDQIIQAYQADSLEELAKLIDVPEDKLIETVQRYNELVEKGQDTDCGKDSKFLSAVDQAPYYAVLLYDGTRGIYGGIKTNHNAQVINQDDQAIEGLYASGVISSGEFFGDYYAGRQALDVASHMGYIAGKAASNYALES